MNFIGVISVTLSSKTANFQDFVKMGETFCLRDAESQSSINKAIPRFWAPFSEIILQGQLTFKKRASYQVIESFKENLIILSYCKVQSFVQ